MEYASLAQTMYETTTALISSKSGALVDDGKDLALVLFLFYASWQGVNWLTNIDGAQVMADCVSMCLKFAIVYSVMLAFWPQSVNDFFRGTTNDIARKVSGGSNIKDGVAAIAQASKRLFISERGELSVNCVEVTIQDANGNPVYDPSGKAMTETVCDKKAANGGATVSLTDLLINFPAVLFTWLLRLVALIFMIMLLFAFLAVTFLAEISYGAALTFGPILIPWLLIPKLEFLFDGWLRFTIIACFIKLVVAWLLGIVLAIISGIKAVAEQVTAATGADLIAADEMAAFFICVFAALAAFVMWQAPSIASGLISGSGGATAQKFGRQNMGSFLANAPNKSISGLASQLGKFQAALGGAKK